MLTLREKRVLFTRLVSSLVYFDAPALGYEVAFGEIVRGKAQAAANARAGSGIKNSLHLDGLAADLLLYHDGTYLVDTKDYEPLGLRWEQYHELCRWGGRFGDGNHFSMEHNGVK